MSEIFTSSYLKKRGHCCKSNCLHCPYGTTATNLGFQVLSIDDSNIETARNLLQKNQASSEDISSSLLAGAFGAKKEIKITDQNRDKFKLLYLKDHLCGLIEMGLFQVKKVYPQEGFEDQGFDEEFVQSFLQE
ncbi:DUF5522 domain-containing protein [Halobacteriovorax sp. GB3]|uniref:DUF5522 domain-containing protein n=1 Tax=Halobacteriovorax sp. GB3 TaxID=2719615 RepID=UPI00236240D6|nr:DUF5522 domain-containing protein [Halobacteriovorax sp. GB3]MDD0852595.1 DUF5522 domain-containing protein [Halobacteriovorax sp. GB3]